MNKEAAIAKFLLDKYKPEAIILHGSRAVGQNRAHSDWDILMLFTEETTKKSNRERIVGEDVEWKGIRIPILDERIYDDLGVILQFAKVLWEEGKTGSELIEQAKRVYSKGSQIDPSKHARCKQFLEHKLNGMLDDVNTPALFLKHQYEFFARATNWWFEILHNENERPFYFALPEIEKRDKEYYDLLMIVCGQGSNEEKIEAGKKIVPKLFANLPE